MINPESFEALFHEYYSPLCNYASKILDDKVIAEDLVQDFFIQLWKKNDFSTIEDYERYFLRSIKNKSIDYLRSNKRIFVPINSIKDELESGESLMAEEDIQPLFYYLAAKLPPKTREVFLLSRVSNLKNREIAEELNISIKTVENQMGRALRALRKLLKQEEFFILALCLEKIISD